jgi:hypothetical protein
MRITEVTVRVGDPQVGTAALAALLELTVEPGPVVRIGWTTVRPVPPDGDGDDHLAILVPGDAYEPAKAWLLARTAALPGPDGVDVAGPPGWDSTSVYVDGPAGLVLELIAHAGHRTGGGSFPAALLGVCEVGVAVPDVPAAIEASGLPVFADTATPDFAAIGDRDGRVILASAGRVWFPTADRLAGVAPTVVTAEGAPRAEVRLGGARLRAG